MFGCYRRGDANDPDTYVAAVAMVLSKYPMDIIKTITDPYSGLPARKNENGYSGLPDVADVKQACEAEAARVERIQRLASLPSKPMPRLEDPHRGREKPNLFVPSDNSKYQALVLRHEGDPKSLCYFEKGHVYKGKDGTVRDGIWVPQGWYEAASVMARASSGPDLPPREDQPAADDFIPFDDDPIAHPEEAAA